MRSGVNVWPVTATPPLNRDVLNSCLRRQDEMPLSVGCDVQYFPFKNPNEILLLPLPQITSHTFISYFSLHYGPIITCYDLYWPTP